MGSVFILSLTDFKNEPDFILISCEASLNEATQPLKSTSEPCHLCSAVEVGCN